MAIPSLNESMNCLMHYSYSHPRNTELGNFISHVKLLVVFHINQYMLKRIINSLINFRPDSVSSMVLARETLQNWMVTPILSVL